MKLQYTFNNFAVMVERTSSHELLVTGSDGEYRYQVYNLTTRQVTVSKPYKRASDAERYGRNALEQVSR